MNQTKRQIFENLDSLRRSVGQPIEAVINYIKNHYTELSENDIFAIKALNESTHEIGNRRGANSLVGTMQIVGCAMSLGFDFSMTNVTAKVMCLTISSIKHMIHHADLEALLKVGSMINQTDVHELSGMFENIKRAFDFLIAVEAEENVGEPALYGLIAHLPTGVNEIGILKSHILVKRQGGERNIQSCLHFLTLLVRISTIRHLLLLRIITCMKTNNFNNSTINPYKNYFWEDIEAGQEYLRFFSEPTLEHVGILAVFDPSVQKELAAYLRFVVRLPLQDMRRVLDNQTFLIQPSTNSSQYMGRKFHSFTSVRAMDSSTDVDNIRIRFQFTAIRDESNLFLIKSPDKEECLLMRRNSYCIYSTKYRNQIGAHWRIIQVKEAGATIDSSSVFVLSTKKRPCRFLYMEESFFGYARGIEETENARNECLFKLIPPGQAPLAIPMPVPGQLPINYRENADNGE